MTPRERAHAILDGGAAHCPGSLRADAPPIASIHGKTCDSVTAAVEVHYRELNRIHSAYLEASKELDEAAAACEVWRRGIITANSERDEALAENRELREALTWAVGMLDGHGVDYHAFYADQWWCECIIAADRDVPGKARGDK